MPAASAASTFLSELSSVPVWKPHLVAAEPAVPGEHVGLHQLEREAQVRARVDVRDRGGEVHRCCGHRNLLENGGAPTRDMNRGPVRGLVRTSSVQRQWPRERGIITVLEYDVITPT